MERDESHNQFKPDYRLLKKYNFFIFLAVLFFVFLPLMLLGTIFYSEEVLTVFQIVLLIAVPIVSISFIAAKFLKWYYRSISYQINDHEVIVKKGIITKTKKIVPFRTITNLEIHRGPLDRYLQLATIDVQTAGGTTGQTGKPEEQLIGLPSDMV